MKQWNVLYWRYAMARGLLLSPGGKKIKFCDVLEQPSVQIV